MVKEFQYLDDCVESWKTKQLKDTNFELMTKEISKMSFKGVYKVGKFANEDELIWNFIFGMEKVGTGYEIHFFLDNAEKEILNSLLNENYSYKTEIWMNEFKITLSSFEEVQLFLDKHVWCFDPGHFY